MMGNYHAAYFPPAPHVDIWLGIQDESFSIGPLAAFVDTGADATIVPLRYLYPFKIYAVETKFLRSQWGERRTIDVYRLDIGINDVRLPGMEIVTDEEGDEVILGRNVLNKLRVLLDGLRQIVEITE